MSRLSKPANHRQGGFTIIEIMIVLAIAGLILLVVLLAVPALQRNARNTERKADVARLAAVLHETISAANSLIPDTCNGSEASCFVRQANLVQYDSNSNRVWYRRLTAPNNSGAAQFDEVKIYNYMRCNLDYDWVADGSPIGGSGHLAIPTGASNGSFVIIYSLETAGGGLNPQCLDA